MENIIRLSIEGMHCDGCVRRVTSAIATVAGAHARSVEVGSASVAIDSAHISAEQIADAINKIGFTARVES